MGSQSLFYYCLVSWLPAVLSDYGMKANAPGWVLFIVQMTMLPVSFASPVIAGRMKDQKPMILVICALDLVSIFLFIYLRSEWIYVNAVILGLSTGLAFSVAILFFSLRSRSSTNAVRVSGMAQSVEYLIAAFGPPLAGKFHDWSGSWQASFFFLGTTVLLTLYFGFKAARNKFVEDAGLLALQQERGNHLMKKNLAGRSRQCSFVII